MTSVLQIIGIWPAGEAVRGVGVTLGTLTASSVTRLLGSVCAVKDLGGGSVQSALTGCMAAYRQDAEHVTVTSKAHLSKAVTKQMAGVCAGQELLEFVVIHASVGTLTPSLHAEPVTNVSTSMTMK